MAEEKSKILVIGGTGYIGKFIVEASVKAGHPTFALVRETTFSNTAKSKIIESFKSHGINFIHGDMHNHECLVNAIKQVDVVISTVGMPHLADQLKVIAAIKEAGTVKRFLPSEFELDVDRVHAIEPAATIYRTKAQIRRAIEAEGVPYTYVVSNIFADVVLSVLGGQPGATSPPRDKIVIYGDGNTKAIFMKEEDICTYAIKAIDDPGTLNKILYMNPASNSLSYNEMISLWEQKIGKTLEKIYVPEGQMLKEIQEAQGCLTKDSTPLSNPELLVKSFCYSIFVKGGAANSEIDSSIGVEASQLYPEVKCTPPDQVLDRFV